MRKFTQQLMINENSGNTFTMGKSTKKLPEEVEDIKDLLQLFEESYRDDVISAAVTIGWANPTALTNMTTCQRVSDISKGIKEIFPDGNIPDKWMLCGKLIIKWKPIKGDWVSAKSGDWVDKSTEVFEIKELDQIVTRVNSIKTLMQRLSRWCDVYTSTMNHGFIGGNIGESIAVLCILKNEYFQ